MEYLPFLLGYALLVNFGWCCDVGVTVTCVSFAGYACIVMMMCTGFVGGTPRFYVVGAALTFGAWV